MEDQLLEFTRSILLDVRIKTFLISAPYQWNTEYDGGLRKAIFSGSDHPYEYDLAVSRFQDKMHQINQEDSIYSIRDDFSCEYLCFRVPDMPTPTNLLLGPFTYEILTVQRISELCELSHIPTHLIDFMQQFYSSVPYIPDDKWLKSMIRRITSHMFHSTEPIKIYRDRIEITSSNGLFISDPPEPDEETITRLEERYENERKLMDYVSIGDYQSVEQLMQDDKLPRPQQRFPDTIRDIKNSLIILNTLCRKAAQNGQVHPVYLDAISKRYATNIENCNSVSKLNQMPKELIRKYCMLVQKHSLKNYSSPIRDVINQITFNLNSDLTLETLAEQAGLNKSYLSSLFKKETGETLTNYVNARRIDHSIYLLNTTQLNIHDIASLCGINDLNYFTRLFKKIKQMTPSEYRNMVHSS